MKGGAILFGLFSPKWKIKPNKGDLKKAFLSVSSYYQNPEKLSQIVRESHHDAVRKYAIDRLLDIVRYEKQYIYDGNHNIISIDKENVIIGYFDECIYLEDDHPEETYDEISALYKCVLAFIDIEIQALKKLQELLMIDDIQHDICEQIRNIFRGANPQCHISLKGRYDALTKIVNANNNTMRHEILENEIMKVQNNINSIMISATQASFRNLRRMSNYLD